MKKALILVVSFLLLFATVGCDDGGRENSDQIHFSDSSDIHIFDNFSDEELQSSAPSKYISLEELYSGVDLSQFSKHGRSTTNSAMWVEKSDYTGIQYGCINTKGEWIVPLTSDITGVHDFDFSDAGLSVVLFSHSKREDFEDTNTSGSFGGIYNSQGEIVGIFELTGRSYSQHLNNGNIIFRYIKLYGGHDFGCYMFCTNTSTFVEMPTPYRDDISGLEFSDGLMLIYNRYDGVKYYDENGNCVLTVENPYYRRVVYADDFKNGQANVTFIGQDEKYYIVTIDKYGNWINEPIQINKSDAQSF
ncbi:MAG: hypothetical protein IKA50_02960 [Clostridia bacterium]|nr:hypothetical protein [Clostridia bacterium]